MSTDFTYNNTTITANGGFTTSSKNTPLDVRTRVYNKADIPTIQYPFVGMHIVVLQDETQQGEMTEYIVKTLITGSMGKQVIGEVELLKNFLNVNSGSSEEVDLSNYATKEELNQKADIEHNHDTEYASKTNEHIHDNKTVLDNIKSTDITNWNNKSNFNGDYNNLINKPTIPNKTSQLTNDSNFANKTEVGNMIAQAQLGGGDDVDLSGYATKDELNQKADIGHSHDTKYASKSSEHTHSNKAILDNITQTKVEEWDNKSNFDGNYNNLTNKPSIPTKVGDLTNDKIYATESFVTSKIAEAQLEGGDGSDVDLSEYATKSYVDDFTGGKKLRYVTQSEYDSLSETEKNNPLIVWNITDSEESNFDGDYNNLTNKPTIPSKTSQLTNDSNFVTKSYVDGEISKIEISDIDTSQFINKEELEDYTGGKKQRYVTQSVYDALSTEDKNDTNIIWNVTDAQYPIPTFSIGTVTKLPANSDPIVTISGNEMNIVLNFGIPVGTLVDDGGNTEVFGDIVMNTNVSVVKTKTATISIKLDKAPTNNQIVNLGTTNNNATLNKTSLTFTPSNYNTAQNVVVTGVNVGTCNINATSNGVAVKTCNVSITEEVFGNIVTDTNKISLKEGGNTSLQVKLDKLPTNSQSVSLSASSTNITINPTTLTFTNTNATNYQTVTINAIEDNNEVEDEYTITISSPHVTNKMIEVVVGDLAEDFVPSPDEPSVYDGEDFNEDLRPFTNDSYVTSPTPRAKKVSIHELHPLRLEMNSENPVEKEGRIACACTGVSDFVKYQWCKLDDEGNIISTVPDGYLYRIPQGSTHEELVRNIIPVKTGKAKFNFMKKEDATVSSYELCFGNSYEIAIVEAEGCGAKIEGYDLTRYTPYRSFELETSANNHVMEYSVSLRRRPSNSATVTLTLNNAVATMQYNGENKNTVTFTFNRNNWFVPQKIVLIGNSVGNCSLEVKSEGNNVVADGNIEILTIPVKVTEPTQSYIFKQNGIRAGVIEGEVGQTYTFTIGRNIEPEIDADVFLMANLSEAEFLNHTNNSITSNSNYSYSIIELPKSDYTREFKIKIKSRPNDGVIFVYAYPYSENAEKENDMPTLFMFNVK